jgi:hypothetical protein
MTPSSWKLVTRGSAAAVSVLACVGLAVALAAGFGGCSREQSVVNIEADPPKPPERLAVPHVNFADITAPSGIRFRHTNGAFGEKLLPETMGGGVAVLDYDGDGKPDLLFINSCAWPGHENPKEPRPAMALYRNKGKGEFEDVTREAGLDLTFYGMGVTVGDYDNDGWPDVFITGVGGNHLFHNEAGAGGRRRFVEVTAASGVGGPGGWPTGAGDFLAQDRPLNWSTSASFLDYDGDGLLDLFVCNYVAWSPAQDLRQPFRLEGLGRAYGPPTAFEGTHCFLYRNLGGGRFEDVSEKAGIVVRDRNLGRVIGKSLGVIVCDVDGDGWPDIVVANDTVQNFFFHNKGNGTFEELGMNTGIAFAEARARGAMGVDWGEYRAGLNALLIGNFADEPDTFLRLDVPKRLLFTDAALAEGIARPSRQRLKFGTFFFDFDLDGFQDLLTNNGHLEPEINKVQPAQTYAQPPQLFWNGGRRFEEVTAQEAGTDLFVPLVGRGCAYADLDGDGDLDLVLVANGGPARVLRNDQQTGHHWVRLVLEGDGRRSNRSAIGARVTLEAGGRTQRREVAAARGYLSQSELALTFGLGDASRVDRVRIDWPGAHPGPSQELRDLAVDRAYTIKQAGAAAP